MIESENKKEPYPVSFNVIFQTQKCLHSILHFSSILLLFFTLSLSHSKKMKIYLPIITWFSLMERHVYQANHLCPALKYANLLPCIIKRHNFSAFTIVKFIYLFTLYVQFQSGYLAVFRLAWSKLEIFPICNEVLCLKMPQKNPCINILFFLLAYGTQPT